MYVHVLHVQWVYMLKCNYFQLFDVCLFVCFELLHATILNTIVVYRTILYVSIIYAIGNVTVAITSIPAVLAEVKT